MKRRIAILALLAIPVFGHPKNTALATKHTITVGNGIKAVGHGFKLLGISTFDTLEASVDAVGVALQGFADAVDLSVAAPLEAMPQPVHELGVAVHVVYLGIDKVGQVLAQ